MEAINRKLAKDLRASRLRLVLMVVVLILLIVVMFRLRTRSSGQAESEENQPVSNAVVPQSAPLAGAAAAPPAQALVPAAPVGKEAEYLLNDSVLGEIQDQGVSVEPGPFFRILYRVAHEKPEDFKSQAKSDLDWKALWDQAASYRGKAVVARGIVLRTWRQPLGANPMKLSEVWAYRLRIEGAPRDSRGHIFDLYSVEKLYGASHGDRITAYGLFLKAQTLEPASKAFDDPEFEAAVVLAPRLEPLAYLDAPEPPKPIAQDGRPEARAVYYLLKRVQTTPFAQVKAAAREDLTRVDFTARPEELLGVPVAVRGGLKRCQRVALDENPLHLPNVYYGQIAGSDRTICTYYCLDIPPGLRMNDSVVLYGYFLKRWTYVSEGDRMITNPIFVGERLVQLVAQRDYMMTILIASMVLACGVFLFIAILRDRAAERRRQLAQASPRKPGTPPANAGGPVS